LGEFNQVNFTDVYPQYQFAHNLKVDEFQVSRPIVRLGSKSVYKKLADHSNIYLCLNTKVRRIVLTADGGKVESFFVKNKSGEEAFIQGGTYIIAAGGIENARLMLHSNTFYSGNTLNPGNNVGRYFMEHPHLQPIDVYLKSHINMDNTTWYKADNGTVNAVWKLSNKIKDKQNLLNYGVFFWNNAQESEANVIEESNNIYFSNDGEYKKFSPVFLFEQTPYRESVIRLSEQKDNDGDPLAELDWKITKSDMVNYRKSVLFFSSLISQNENARVRFKKEFTKQDWSDVFIGWGNHHMGTTRMSHRSNEGVVDINCKVFGVSNLYISGSSVFPVSDYVNPTLNIVALSLRMADHVLSKHCCEYQTFTYGKGSKFNSTLKTGWSYPEDEGVWTNGKVSRIVIRGASAKSIQIYGHDFSNAAGLVVVNNKVIFEGLLRDFLNKSMSIEKSSKEGDVIKIDIKFDDVKSPLQLGLSKDSRKLGIFIKKLKVIYE
jgi:choline dehydrogenase-like flavoprotein